MFGFFTSKPEQHEWVPDVYPKRIVFAELFEEMRKQREEAAAKARERAISYKPPVEVVQGRNGRFLKVGCASGEGALVPLEHLVAVSLRRGDRSRFGDADLVRVIFQVTSGFQHEVLVEKASADKLIEAARAAWVGGEA